MSMYLEKLTVEKKKRQNESVQSNAVHWGI